VSQHDPICRCNSPTCRTLVVAVLADDDTQQHHVIIQLDARVRDVVNC
jgi:hypothetical protein